MKFQHTAARRRLAIAALAKWEPRIVSTHSRPKAAGARHGDSITNDKGFNTQPPEGGWLICVFITFCLRVSTHSRPKAAGAAKKPSCANQASFNTQPPEGGWDDELPEWQREFSFQHTAARRRLDVVSSQGKGGTWFQHTAARRRLGEDKRCNCPSRTFQHTAARRRLVRHPP